MFVKIHFYHKKKTGGEMDKRETMSYALSCFERFSLMRMLLNLPMAISPSLFLSLNVFPGPSGCSGTPRVVLTALKSDHNHRL